MGRSLRLFAVATVASCGGGRGSEQPDAPDVAFDRAALLANVADHVIIPTYDAFTIDAQAMVAAIDAHCAALASGTNDPAAARARWAKAMDTWETADALLVGPVAATDATLRNRIYAWPLVAPCTIDQDVVARWNNPGSYDVTTRLDNVRSLSAIEYLLHYEADVSSCPITPAGWDALAADKPRARCELASVIAADVATQAAGLAMQWKPEGGNYRATLVAGERDAVNMVSDALFYVDSVVKDMKLAEPAGITINACGTVEMACEREAEHRFADRTSPAIRINLRALKAAFTGTTTTSDGLGFDDYLIAVGASDVATRMTQEIDAAIAAADALPDQFLPALTSNRAPIVAAHASIKAITDDLKSQFLTVLGLEIPADVAGDND